MDQKRFLVLLILLCVGAALSGLLLMQHHGEDAAVAAVNQLCGDGQTSGCQNVAQSPYSAFAGFPLAAWGLVFYLALLALSLVSAQAGDEAKAWAGRVGFFALLLALGIDALLLAIQAFEIKAYCTLCLATYAVNAGGVWALWPARRSRAKPQGTAGSLLLVGAGLSALAAAAAVFAWNAALGERAARRAGAILGGPGAAGPASLRDAQAEIAKLKETLDDPGKYERYLADRSAQQFETAAVQDLDLGGVPFKGPADAKIRVLEFSDFLCPYCRAIAAAFRDFIPHTEGRVALYFKNYPLDKECNAAIEGTVHPGACWLARGAICAAGQGRFWQYHDKVFEAPLTNPGREDVVKIAGTAGLDGARLAACLDSPDTGSRLQAEIVEAGRAGVRGTPTVFINGKKIPRLNDFLTLVDKEGARFGLAPLAKAAKPAQ